MPYHMVSQLMKTSARRPPVLLDESMCVGRHVRDTVSAMRQTRRHVLEAAGFVPTKDLAGIDRIIVESGYGAPAIEGSELIVSPDVSSEDLLRIFGNLAYGKLSDSESDQWTTLFQRDMNSGRRVVLASAPSDKFAESYAAFHTRPKKLRDDSPSAYRFFENLYGKHMDQMWGV